MHWLHVRPNSEFPENRHFSPCFLACFYPKFTSKIRKKKFLFPQFFWKLCRISGKYSEAIRRSAKTCVFLFSKIQKFAERGKKGEKKIQKFAEFRFFSWILVTKICRKSAYKKTKICQKSAYFPGNRNSASRVANA